MNKRSVGMFLGFWFCVSFLLMIDPDNGFITKLHIGSGIISYLANISMAFVAVAVLYLFRKIMHNYPVANTEELGKKAMQDPVGAGLYAISMAIFTLAYAVIILAVLK